MSSTITAIVGSNGDGKTLGAVAIYVDKAIKKGRPVWSTFDILDPETGERHPNTYKLTTWHQLLELRDCLLVLDEINSEFPSRGAMQLPPELMSLIHQLRKPRVDLVWTAVNWARADIALREATKIVITAKGFRPDKWLREPGIAPLLKPSGIKIVDTKGKPMKLEEEWPPMRLFRYLSYDASTFDEFTIHAVKGIKPLKRQWYWRPWHNHQNMYSTNETVPLLDNISATGTCLKCGGQRQKPTCHCQTPRVTRAVARPRKAPNDNGQ
jgi:hypothetical protein